MNHRIIVLKNNLFSQIPSICPDRGRLITEYYQKNERKPSIYKRAKAFEHIINNMHVNIHPQELIVGNQASNPRSAPLFPEFSVSFLLEEINSFEKRPFDRFLVDKETKKAIRCITEFWQGKTHEDQVIFWTNKTLSPELKKAFDFNSFILNNVCYAGVRKSSGDGHIIVNFGKILTVGLEGIINEAQAALHTLNIKDSENVEKQLFLESAIITCQAAISFAERYASIAEKMAKNENNPQRKKELIRISKNCLNVPKKPASNFWEALQSVWFILLLIQIESNGHSVSLGRFDRYLYRFYQKNIALKIYSEEQILELLECFYLKVNEINKVRPWNETLYKNGYPMFQTLTVGGQTPEGKDSSNALTSLILQCSEELKLPQPTTVFRVFDRTKETLMLRACQSLYRHGGGLPSFFNDEAIVPALTHIGIPLNEARDYAIAGCSEAVIPGKSLSFTGGDCYFNLPTLLDLTLHGGKNRRNDTLLYGNPEKKDLFTFKSIEEILECFKKQLSYYIKFIVPLTNITSKVDYELNPTPFVSSLVDYRLAIGKDLSAGGGPNSKYSHTIIQGHGVANVANSLCALDEILFKKKIITNKALNQLLDNNFEGIEGEHFRQKLLALPKYGNDDDRVDYYAREIAHFFAREVQKYQPWRGGVFGPSLQGLTANVPEGANLGATPDGRKAGEPIADNISPQAGTDIKGPTASIKSVSKIDHTLFVNGNILNLKIHPSALKGQGINAFSALIRTFFDLKGYQLQFNILSAETLKKAQLYPEKNNHLIVKVAGYSAQFVSLSKELQDQIISRTEHILKS